MYNKKFVRLALLAALRAISNLETDCVTHDRLRNPKLDLLIAIREYLNQLNPPHKPIIHEIDYPGHKYND